MATRYCINQARVWQPFVNQWTTRLYLSEAAAQYNPNIPWLQMDAENIRKETKAFFLAMYKHFEEVSFPPMQSEDVDLLYDRVTHITCWKAHIALKRLLCDDSPTHIIQYVCRGRTE